MDLDPAAPKIIEFCKLYNGEVDEEYMDKNLPQFGRTPQIRQANRDIIKEQKKKNKGNLLIPISIVNSNGFPEHFFDKSSGKYILVNLDDTGMILERSTETISSIRITGASLAVTEMVEKAQAVLDSGIVPVNVESVQKQLESIQRLGDLYAANIAISRNSISKLFYFDYDQLNSDVQKVSNYFRTAMLGNNTTGNRGELNQMIELYNKTNKTLYEIKIIKNSVSAVFDEMNAIAKEMLGVEPRDLDAMLENPGKYTIPVRFISNPLQNQKDKVKIFYNCDAMISILQSVQPRIAELKQVNQNFLPKISSGIDNLSQQINEILNQRKYFERLLVTDTQPSAKNVQQGNGENEKEVKAAYEKVQLSIIELNRSYNRILESIKSVENQQDPTFQASLKEQQARLDQLAPAVQENEAYRNTMPTMVKEAYEKIFSRKTGEISELTNTVNTNIQKMNELLTPILAEINAKRDATPLWNQSSVAIQDTVTRPNVDKDKIAAKLSTTTANDVQLRNSLKTLAASVISTLNQEQTIKTRITVSQMTPNHTAAQSLIAKMKGVPATPDSFPAALTQYNKDKNETALISQYNIFLAEEQKIKGLLEANAKTLLTMDQKNPDVTTLLDSINPLTQPSSATYLNKTFNTYVATKMPPMLKVPLLPVV